MDVTKMLEADHRQVEDLFTDIENATGAARQPIIDEIAHALRAHMELEEQIVYPMMKPVLGAEVVEEGVIEHDLARTNLEEMLALAPDGPGFGAALEAVKAVIDHHVEEEEGDVFAKLRKDGREVLDQMASPFMKKRMELGLPMDAPALAAASTKDELLAEAKSAGVESTSSMTKVELAKALAAKMA